MRGAHGAPGGPVARAAAGAAGSAVAGERPRAVVLIDGEHYPPVVRDTLAGLAARHDLVAALFLGGGEKLREAGAEELVELVGPRVAQLLGAAQEERGHELVIARQPGERVAHHRWIVLAVDQYERTAAPAGHVPCVVAGPGDRAHAGPARHSPRSRRVVSAPNFS